MSHLHDTISGTHVHDDGSWGAGASVPVITSLTALSGTELSVAWTGTATEYRLNSGTPTALPDGTSPDTISGLTPNTEYTVELRDGAGAWSTGVAEFTDNTGTGGGEIPATDVVDLAAGWPIRSSATSGIAAGFPVRTSASPSLAAGWAVEGDFEVAVIDLSAGWAVRSSSSPSLQVGWGVEYTGGSADPAAVWSYVLTNGQTAQEALLELLGKVTELHRIHGLQAGVPLVVTQTARTAGAIAQTIATAGSSTTVTRT